MRTIHIVTAALMAAGLGSLAYRSQSSTSRLQVQQASTYGIPLEGGLPIGQYPLTNNEIQKMILRNDPNEIRAHGWAVLNALISSNPQGQDGNSGYEASWDFKDQPWENKCTLGLGGNNTLCPKPAPATNATCQLPKPNDRTLYGPIIETILQQQVGSMTLGNLPASPPAPSSAQQFVSSVRYNGQAADFIRKHCLYSAEGLTRLTAANQFDGRAVIVKLIWNMPDANQQIPVWNPDFDKVPQSKIPPNTGDWPRVKVDMNEALSCPANAAFQGFANSAPPSPSSTVPINCFYHRRYPCDFLGMGKIPSTLTQVTFCSKGHTNFDLFLMGVHIITAEQNDWVWNTFWWTPNPDGDPFHRDQPDNISSKSPWRFYAMNIAISRTTPLEQDGSPHVAFNPYLEGPNENSTSSNCMYCHSMAVMRTGTTTVPAITAAQEIRSGSPPPCAYKATVKTHCQMDGLLKNDDSYFRGAVTTHFLWSVADNQDPLKRNDVGLLDSIQIKGIP